MYEVKDLKRLPCAGLSNMLELSNKLLHDIMNTQVVGKYTLAKKKMKTDIAYPYVSYLEMLVSNLNLQGKVNFLTQAQCQLLYNKSMSLTASVEVSFLDSYDMTYNQFETMRREYQEATRQLDNGNSVTTPTDHQSTSMNAQEHTAVGDAGESAESRSDAEILDQDKSLYRAGTKCTNEGSVTKDERYDAERNASCQNICRKSHYICGRYQVEVQGI